MDELDLRFLVDGPLEPRAALLSERRAQAQPCGLERDRHGLRGVVALHMAHRVALPKPVASFGKNLD
jgi:hypothetical protein